MAVARRLSRAARLRAEDLHMLIVTGGVWALGEPHHEAEAQVDLTMRNLAALARNFADAGFAPVVDALFDTADRLAIFREAFGQRLRFIVLDVDEHTCRRRNASRPAIEQFAFGDYAGLRAGMQKAFGDQGWWLNTGAQTIDESVDLVLAGADDRARVS